MRSVTNRHASKKEKGIEWLEGKLNGAACKPVNEFIVFPRSRSAAVIISAAFQKSRPRTPPCSPK